MGGTDTLSTVSNTPFQDYHRGFEVYRSAGADCGRKSPEEWIGGGAGAVEVARGRAWTERVGFRVQSAGCRVKGVGCRV